MFLDGKCLANGVDLEALEASRFMHVLAYLIVEEGLVEKEVSEAREKLRTDVHKVYNQNTVNNLYGRSNDEAGDPMSREPLPYIEPTQETDFGFAGLDAPFE